MAGEGATLSQALQCLTDALCSVPAVCQPVGCGDGKGRTKGSQLSGSRMAARAMMMMVLVLISLKFGKLQNRASWASFHRRMTAMTPCLRLLGIFIWRVDGPFPNGACA